MPKEHLVFVDNLRILLMVLVILVHLAITYGSPVGGWYYHEGQPGMIESLIYVSFLGVSQSFFMGFFFLISAYFTPGSYERKGARRFLKDRLKRLGIPLLFYVIFIDPVLDYALELSYGFSGSFPDFLGLYVTNYDGLESGPLWFVETLLIFDCCYLLWRRLAKNTTRVHKTPGNTTIAFFALLLGLVTFCVRIWFPIGSNFELLNLQLPFFPQYIALFIIGLIASGGNWFTQISINTGKLWSYVAAVLLILFPVILAVILSSDDPTRLAGGIYQEAFMYALWEQLIGVSIIIALTVIFREKYNSQGSFAKSMSSSVYTVYIIHAPVLVFLALGLRGIVLPPLLKFVLVAPFALSLCFALGNFIRKIPIARGIL